MSRGPGRSRLQITSGTLAGRRLEVAKGVRPTEARVREALASIWQLRLPGSRVLDLFAGSGAVGLEALSRGAREAWLVDATPASLGALRRNCQTLAPDQTHILRRRLPADGSFLQGEHFDLIFADPPYEFRDTEKLLNGAAAWLADGGELVLEHDRRGDPEARVGDLERVDLRTYGESCLSFYRQAIDESPTSVD